MSNSGQLQFIVCWLLSTSLVYGLSFKSGQAGTKEKYYEYMVSARARGRHFDGTEIQEKNCKDQLKLCGSYTRFCDLFRIVREACPSSCNMCSVPHALSCENMPFGCCWDNITIAKGPNQQGCPECVDIHKDCKILVHQCPFRAEIRRVCPVTCGANCNICADDPYQKEICPYYRKAGFCTVDRDLMAKHCKRTCQFCNSYYD